LVFPHVNSGFPLSLPLRLWSALTTLPLLVNKSASFGSACGLPSLGPVFLSSPPTSFGSLQPPLLPLDFLLSGVLAEHLHFDARASRQAQSEKRPLSSRRPVFLLLPTIPIVLAPCPPLFSCKSGAKTRPFLSNFPFPPSRRSPSVL